MKTAKLKRLSIMIAIALLASSHAYALPQGGVVTKGSADIAVSGKTMNITQASQKAVLDWRNFDIARQETVNFKQNASMAALNRVNDGNMTQILGSLNAGGKIFLINPAGITFGSGAQINVGALVASTKNITDDNFMNGKYVFSGNSAEKVINNADIMAKGGVVAFLANKVENTGTINTEGGTTALAAGNAFTLDLEGDGKINLVVDEAAVEAGAINTGTIKADGGVVLMTARDASAAINTVVKNTGIIEAKTLGDITGKISIDGGKAGVTEISGTLDASGNEAGQKAGEVVINGKYTEVKPDAVLLAKGDAAGGLIETSGAVVSVADEAYIDTSSVNGATGTWLLDPMNLIIQNDVAGGTEIPAGTGDFSQRYTTDTHISATSLSNRLATNNVTLETLDTANNEVSNILVNDIIYKKGSTDTTLTLRAERNVTINAEIKPEENATGKLNLLLHSDYDPKMDPSKKRTDTIGAVVINADIDTNGGDFTAGSGFTIDQATVGTQFGQAGENRILKTRGGNITIYGDVGIALGSDVSEATGDNNYTLTLDSTGSSKDGNVIITGSIDSGNDYRLVDFNGTADEILRFDTVKAAYLDDTGGKWYHWTYNNNDPTKSKLVEHYDPYWVDQRNEADRGLTTTVAGRYGYDNTDNQLYYYSYSGTSGKVYNNGVTDYADVYRYDRLVTDRSKQRAAIKNSQNLDLVRMWENVSAMGKYKLIPILDTNGNVTGYTATKTNGGSAVGDTYLATLATNLENSLANSELAGRSDEMMVGAQMVRITSRPGTKGDILWTQGPEASGGDTATGPNHYPIYQGSDTMTITGTKFAEFDAVTSGSSTGTGTNPDGDGTNITKVEPGFINKFTSKLHAKYAEPNDSGNNICIGWTSASMWDDVGETVDTVHGYVTETNLAHSSLRVNAGSGDVTLAKNTLSASDTAAHRIGASSALFNLDIDSTGNVIVGNNDTVASVTVDNKFTIGSASAPSKTATVTGNIKAGMAGKAVFPIDTADTDIVNNVNIQAVDLVDVDGINAVNGGVYLKSSGGTYEQDANKIGKGSDKIYNGTGTVAFDSTGKMVLGGPVEAQSRIIVNAEGVLEAANTVTLTTRDSAENWMVHSATPYEDTFGGIKSSEKATWVTDTEAAENLNGMVFTYRPHAYAVVPNATKEYGDTGITAFDSTSVVIKDESTAHNVVATTLDGQSITDIGYAVEKPTGYGSVYVGDKAEDVFNTQPVGTNKTESDGYAPTATVGDGTNTYKGKNYDKTSGYTDAAYVSGKYTMVLTSGNRPEDTKKANTVYTVGEREGQLTITPKNLKITADDIATIYGTVVDPSTGKYTLGSGTATAITENKGVTLVNADILQVVYDPTNAFINSDSDGTYDKTNNVGTYYEDTVIAYTIKDGDADKSKNYAVTLEKGDTTITPASLEIGLEAVTRVYGTKDATYAVKALTAENLVNGDTASDVTASLNTSSAVINDTALTGSAEGRVTHDVGDTYTWTLDNKSTGYDSQITLGGEKAGNYTITVVGTAQSTVTPATLTVTTSDSDTESIVYGTANSGYTYTTTVSGLVNGDNEGKDPAAVSGSGYAGGSGTFNVTTDKVTTDSGEATADTPVTVTNSTKAYTGKDKTADVGTNYETVGVLAPSTLKNYTITTTNDNVNITPASLEIGLEAVTRVYGTKDATYAVKALTAENLVNGDTASDVTASLNTSSAVINDTALTGSAEGRVTHDVGDTYTWTLDNKSTGYDSQVTLGGEKAGNYTITVVGTAQSTVTPATLTVTTSDSDTESIVYGTANSGYTYTTTVSGLVNGDNEGKDPAAVSGSGYAGGSGTFNVTTDKVTTDSGEATADTPVTVTNSTKAYTGKDKTADVGTNYETVGVLAPSTLKNYTITTTNDNVNITPASLEIGLEAVTRVYGTKDATYAVKALTAENLVNGDTASDVTASLNTSSAVINDTALTGSAEGRVTHDVGDTYTWTLDNKSTGYDSQVTLGGEKAGNYTITVVGTAQSTVTPATLTVTTSDSDTESIVYGTANSGYTYTTTVSGLVNGDNEGKDPAAVSGSGYAGGSGTFNVTTDKVTTDSGEATADTPVTVTNSTKAYTGKDKTADVGTNYETVGVLAPSTLKNYTITTTNDNVNITPASLEIGLEAVTRVYGTKDATYAVKALTAENLVNGDTASDVTASLNTSSAVINDTALTGSAEGRVTHDVGDTYTWTLDNKSTGYDSQITLGGEKAGNYTITVVGTAQSTVTPATLTVTTSDSDTESIVYGTANSGYTYTTTVSGLVNGDNEGKDPAAVSGSGYAGGSGTFNVTTDKVTTDSGEATADTPVTVTNSTKAYTGKDKTADVGTNYETVGVLAPSTLKNYTITTTNDNVNITPASLEIGLEAVTRVYGTKDATYAVKALTAENLVNGDTASDVTASLNTSSAVINDTALTGSAEGRVTHDVGDTYTWTLDNKSTGYDSQVTLGGEKAGNYTITVVGTAQSTITPASLEIGLEAVTRVYGTKDATYAVKALTAENLVNGDTASDVTASLNTSSAVINDTALTGSAEGRVTHDVGDTYTWTLDNKSTGYDSQITLGGEKAGNYTITVVGTAQSTVTPATLTVTTSDSDTESIVYGTANSGYTYTTTVSGLVNGDNEGKDPTAVEGNGFAGGTGTFKLTTNDGEETVTVTNSTAAYTNTDNTDNVGAGYATTGKLSPDELKNYIVEYADDTVDITKANLTVTLTDVERTYGDITITSPTDGKYAGTVSGSVNGDTVTLNLDESAITDGALTGKTSGRVTNNVGSYTWNTTVAGLGLSEKDANNYNVTIEDAKSIVNKAKLTVTADDKNTTEGTVVPLTGSVTGTVNGDTFTGVYTTAGFIDTTGDGNYDTTKAAGSYEIGASVAEDYGTNYELTVVPGTLTISAKENPEPEPEPIYPVPPIWQEPTPYDGHYSFRGDGAGGRGRGFGRDVDKRTYELPLFGYAGGKYSAVGSYDAVETPDGIKMQPSATRLTVPKRQNSVRSIISTRFRIAETEGNFNLSYDGTILDIYPASETEKAMLQNAGNKGFEALGSQSLADALAKMGLMLADIRGVCVHSDETLAETAGQ